MTEASNPPGSAPAPSPAPTPPVAWTPPADWPPLPTDPAERDAFLRMWHTEAVREQTRALASAVAQNTILIDLQRQLLAAVNREDSYAMKKVFEALRIVHADK